MFPDTLLDLSIHHITLLFNITSVFFCIIDIMLTEVTETFIWGPEQF